jgi:YggT family protein
MFALVNLLNAVASLLDVLIQSLMLILIVNAVLSWVRPDPSNPIVMFLERVSDVACNPVRKLFPTVYSGIDFAPFIVLLVLQFLGRMFVVATLHGLAGRMG